MIDTVNLPRIGIGTDVHRLAPGVPMHLAGLAWPDSPVGLEGHSDGDVAARVAIRFEELLESCRIISRLLEDLPDGALLVQVSSPVPGRLAVGLIEGWRGPVVVALEVGHDGMIQRCHPHDPSWQNWPVLEHAVIDNIVPDLPLINKSFNLSYSGHDL